MRSLAAGQQRFGSLRHRLLSSSGAQLRRGPRQFWFRAQAVAQPGPQCLYQGFSQYNEVVTVLEIPEDPVEPQHQPLAGSRVLLLDRTGSIHSVYRRDRVLTSGYWDVLATLPSLVPPGPVGLLGLGAGTIPRIIGAHYPRCRPSSDDGGGGDGVRDGGGHLRAGGGFVVHGWELDPGVVMASRLFLGMDELERNDQLVTHTGDALCPSAAVPGGFSGVIVDLFARGRLLPQLTKESTWECIRDRLAASEPGSCSPPPRVMANLGQAPPAVPGMRWQAEAYTTLRAYEAMEKAFGGEVSLLTVESNTLALSGPLPGPDQWPGVLPPGLRHLEVQAGYWARDVYPLQRVAVDLELW